MWALPELVEAAARTGNTEVAAGALEQLAETTQAGGTDFGLGLEARCRALLSGGTAADELYREAIDRLGRTRLRPELARAHLLYGEWLRREGRRVDARGQLRTAHDTLDAIGMKAFAARARRELIATGEKVPKRSVEAHDRLTPQEEQIARLARDGRTSAEIGAQLFLSARTVEWHLGKVFTKLGIGSRRELHAALAQREQDGRAAQPKVSTTGGLPGQFLRPPFTREQQRTPRPQEVFLRGGFARAGGVAGPDVLDGLLRCSGRNAGGPGDQVLQGQRLSRPGRRHPGPFGKKEIQLV